MNLGNIIYKFRKDKNLKQAEVAKRANITQSYLSRVENNQTLPELNSLKAITEVIEIPLPLLIFSMLDESEIKEEKRETYKIIYPMIQTLIEKMI